MSKLTRPEATRNNARNREIDRLRGDLARINRHMPHRCRETQRRAQATLARLEAELAPLEAELLEAEDLFAQPGVAS